MLLFPRFTCGYKLGGTKSFRLSSSKLFGKIGTNAQNVKSASLPILIADPGKIFVQVDQAGAEAKIVAYECARGNLQLLFEHGIKPHSYLAAHIFSQQFGYKKYIGLPIPELAADAAAMQIFKIIKNSGKPYDIGKMTCHAKNYREGPNTFRISCLEKSGGILVITAAEAKAFLAMHEQIFPEVFDWQNEIEQIGRTTRILRNLFGYPREFYGKFSDTLIREMLSWIPQSTVGTITNIACSELQAYIEEQDKDWDLLNNKHDSYLAQCPIGEQEELALVMKGFIEKDLVSTRGNKYRMGSEVMVGFNAGKKSKDNPNGLEEIKI